MGPELKQELQIRQKAIHETPDNEKNVISNMKAAVMDENSEKSDPTKSPTAYGPTVNNNKLPNGTPLKRKEEHLLFLPFLPFDV